MMQTRGLGYSAEFRKMLPDLVRYARMYQSQRGFARSLGISLHALSQWELGINLPTHENLERIWHYLEEQGRV